MLGSTLKIGTNHPKTTPPPPRHAPPRVSRAARGAVGVHPAGAQPVQGLSPQPITPQLHSYPRLHLLGLDACRPRHRNPFEPRKFVFVFLSPSCWNCVCRGRRRWPSNSAAAPLPAHLQGVTPKSCQDFGTYTCPGMPLRGQAHTSSPLPLPAARTQCNYKPLKLYQPPGSVINDSKCPRL